MRVLSAAILASLLTVSAAAQRPLEFDAGYIVPASGDSLVGEIASRSSLDHTIRALFWEDGDDDFAVYRPQHLSAYGFYDGRRFVSRELVPGPYQQPEQLFLQVLVEGPLTLYAYSIVHRPPPLESALGAIAPVESAVAQLVRAYHEQLEISNGRFAIEAHGRVRALYEYRRLHDEEPHRKVLDRQYRRVLAESFAECPSEQARLRRVRFASRELVNAVGRYHDCIEQSSEAMGVGPGTRGLIIRLAARGGAGRAAVVSRADGTRLDGRAGAYGALRAELFGQGSRERTAFTAELAYKTKGTTAEEEHEALRPFHARHFNLPIIAVSLGIQHEWSSLGGMVVGTGLTGGRLIGQDATIAYIPRTVASMPFGVYSWDVGIFGEVLGRVPIAGARSVTAGLRGELTFLGDNPFPFKLRSNDGEPFGHAAQSLFLVVGLGL